MSKVLKPGDLTKVQGPWQHTCHTCRSKVELTVNDRQLIRGTIAKYGWWCPACGTPLYTKDISNY